MTTKAARKPKRYVASTSKGMTAASPGYYSCVRELRGLQPSLVVSYCNHGHPTRAGAVECAAKQLRRCRVRRKSGRGKA